MPLTRITEPYFFKVLMNELNIKKKKVKDVDSERQIIARGINLARLSDQVVTSEDDEEDDGLRFNRN